MYDSSMTMAAWFYSDVFCHAHTEEIILQTIENQGPQFNRLAARAPDRVVGVCKAGVGVEGGNATITKRVEAG